jgi:hypothetical protein
MSLSQSLRRLKPSASSKPDLLVDRCDYVGVCRGDSWFRPRRRTSQLTVGLWLVVLVMILFLCAFWLAQRLPG